MLRSLPRHHGLRLGSARSRSVRRPGRQGIRAGRPASPRRRATRDYGWAAAPDGPAEAGSLDVGDSDGDGLGAADAGDGLDAAGEGVGGRLVCPVGDGLGDGVGVGVDVGLTSCEVDVVDSGDGRTSR